jgi:hypothetical protein
MPIRFPFRRAGPADANQPNTAESKFENTAVSGTKPKDIKEPVEYKLSGEHLPLPSVVPPFNAALRTVALGCLDMRLHVE